MSLHQLELLQEEELNLRSAASILRSLDFYPSYPIDPGLSVFDYEIKYALWYRGHSQSTDKLPKQDQG